MTPKYYITKFLFVAVFAIVASVGTDASAQKVDVRISSREAYVGSPLSLEITIRNAKKYETPIIPAIDGCDVKSGGTPSRSSQLTIFNGRRSESQSVTMRYFITPRKEGTFEISEFSIVVDGKKNVVAPIEFIAKKSETGDLLFVEIEGGKEKVYVGEELDQTLKIWIKPFVDRKNKITLSEGNMWQMISEQTSWGSFAESLKEMAQLNRRPSGKEVLRVDEKGRRRSYYLYEFEAKTYPTRPGSISADDVQIVVDYPESIGRSRDPFDNLFSRSAFARRLAVTSSRPIVAEAMVDSTEVLPIPTLGRPSDYRGAVGEYKLAVVAAKKTASAGDPISLTIGIRGDGPMELVQAPPLSELPALTKDFKVSDKPLAGLVQDSTKAFTASVRPRRAGIKEIPAIPFSFFDPKSESFKTIYSDPISIEVTESETLALDSIVGKSRGDKGESDSKQVELAADGPDFANHTSVSALNSQTRRGRIGWVPLVVIPPLVWLASLIFTRRGSVLAGLPNFKSAKTRCRGAIDGASTYDELVAALTRFVSESLKERCPTPLAAIGVLRTTGLPTTANELELFFSNCERGDFKFSGRSFEEIQREAKFFTTKIETELESSGKVSGRKLKSLSRKSKSSVTRLIGRIVGMILFVLSIQLGQSSFGDDAKNENESSAVSLVTLSESQRQSVFAEANELYLAAQESAKTDSAEATEGFANASAKYQMLVDSGVANRKLFINLGNAYLQSGKLGHAIANYQRAKSLDPFDQQVELNLRFAFSKVKGLDEAKEPAVVQGRWGMIVKNIQMVNDWLIGTVGRAAIFWTLGLVSVLFWGLLIVKNFGWRIPVWSLAWLPLLLLAVTLTSVLLDETETVANRLGIVVADQLVLRAGNGEHFETVSTVDSAEGHSVKVISRRADWIQIETAKGKVGWVSAKRIVEV